MDKAASERLATVRALNGAPNVAPPPPPSAESIVMTGSPTASHAPPASGSKPQSIEDQFTSMTQTMKALKIEPAKFDDDEEEKKGFFSRFRK